MTIEHDERGHGSNPDDPVVSAHCGSRLEPKTGRAREVAARYRFERVPIPDGLDSVDPVRLYRRTRSFYCEFWDPTQRKTVKIRIEGSFTQAYLRAREEQERILRIRANKPLRNIMSHSGLVEAFLADVSSRVEAGQIKLPTLKRYRSALAFYAQFTSQEEIQGRYPNPAEVGEEFGREFDVFLRSVETSPNGHPNTPKRPIRSSGFIIGTVRAMFAWAQERAGK